MDEISNQPIFIWEVSQEANGNIEVVMALWDKKPGLNSQRLSEVKVADSFQTTLHKENFTDLDNWEVQTHQLGRSRLLLENVSIGGNKLQIYVNE